MLESGHLKMGLRLVVVGSIADRPFYNLTHFMLTDKTAGQVLEMYVSGNLGKNNKRLTSASLNDGYTQPH